MTKLILASASPRRKQYLSYLGTDFEVIVPNVDESKIDAEKPSDLVLRLSKLKAQAVSLNHPQDIVIAADTVVAFEDTILGKPKDRVDAFNMIKLLQGKDHFVYTGTTIPFSIFPVIVVYLILSKYIVGGTTLGGVKG